jgi:hypothetical protein
MVKLDLSSDSPKVEFRVRVPVETPNARLWETSAASYCAPPGSNSCSRGINGSASGFYPDVMRVRVLPGAPN